MGFYVLRGGQGGGGGKLEFGERFSAQMMPCTYLGCRSRCRLSVILSVEPYQHARGTPAQEHMGEPRTVSDARAVTE